MSVEEMAKIIYAMTLTMSDVELKDTKEEIEAITNNLKTIEHSPLYEALNFIAEDNRDNVIDIDDIIEKHK